MSSPTFTLADYVVFSLMLLLSSCIGLFFGIRAKLNKQINTEEFLTGSRNLPLLPVALSLSASFTSATTILGIPGEVYTRGATIWLWAFGMFIAFPVVAFYIGPVIHSLQLTNAYEYLELRFNKTVRTIGSVSFAVVILIYMAAVLYAPAVALSEVTGLSRDVSIVAIGLICSVYTSLGGIRGVVWTDAFQLVVVWLGLLIILFKGASDVGGWSKVWRISKEGGRLPEFNMDPNPFIRHTFWTLCIGGGFNMMTVYGANQGNLQRYSSLKSVRDVRIAVLLNIPFWCCYLSILSLLGLVMFAFFHDCDPLHTKLSGRSDRLIPYFVLKTMEGLPGLPGLFIASIFSASISTLSSGINALGAVTIEDVFRPVYMCVKHKMPSEKLLSIVTVLLVALFGGVTIALAYAADLLGATALKISFGVFGMVGGPLLGLFLNGIFVPFINSAGAITGFVSSLGVCLYAGIDPVVRGASPGSLPLGTSQCLNGTNDSQRHLDVTEMFTVLNNFTIAGNQTDEIRLPDLDNPLVLSYLHLSTLALIVSTVVAMVTSVVTGCNGQNKADQRTYIKYSFLASYGGHQNEKEHISDSELNNLAKYDANTDL